jgi:helix-turn-helix protein
MVVHAGRVTKVDLLLHPVRLRILQAFLGGRELTTSQLAAELADLPRGRLYRHVALLAESGVLTVVAERPVRGAVERTYALRLGAAYLDPATMANFSREEHARAFGTFVAGLLAEYDRYLDAPGTDPVRDGVSYSMNAVWLTDQEYATFLRDVAALMQPRTALSPGAGRKRRLIASAFLPMPTAVGGGNA